MRTLPWRVSCCKRGMRNRSRGRGAGFWQAGKKIVFHPAGLTRLGVFDLRPAGITLDDTQARSLREAADAWCRNAWPGPDIHDRSADTNPRLLLHFVRKVQGRAGAAEGRLCRRVMKRRFSWGRRTVRSRGRCGRCNRTDNCTRSRAFASRVLRVRNPQLGIDSCGQSRMDRAGVFYLGVECYSGSGYETGRENRGKSAPAHVAAPSKLGTTSAIIPINAFRFAARSSTRYSLNRYDFQQLKG